MSLQTYFDRLDEEYALISEIHAQCISNQDRCAAKVPSGYRWKPFIVKMLKIYFWVRSPFAPQKTCKLVWPLGRETSIDQVQANCSIEVEELKGTTIASNKSLSKVERKKKRPLIMVNNRSIKRKNCFRPSVLEGIFLFGASIRAGWILGAWITFKRNWRGEQTLQCQWGESQLSGHSGHRARLSVCQQQIRASDLFCTISFPFPQTIAARHLDDTSSPQQIHLSIKHWATWNETKANTSKKKTLD